MTGRTPRSTRSDTLLPSTTLFRSDVPEGAGREDARGEQDERRRSRGCLRAEQDLGLLAPAHGVRVLGDQPAEERVEGTGADAGLPALQCRVEGRDELVDVPACASCDVHPRRPRDAHEVTLDLPKEVVAALLVDEVPLVEGDDEGTAGHGDGREAPQVLLGARLG